MKEKVRDIEDFMLDPQFKNWVLNPQAETNEFWGKWLKNNPSQKTQFLLAKEMIQNTEFRKVDVPELAAERVLNRVLEGDKEVANGNGQATRFIPWKTMMRVAASIALLFAVYWISGNLKDSAKQPIEVAEITTKENPAGRKSQVFLPDGSIVWLNSASSLQYRAHFSGSERRVVLKGEAYFDVAKDQDKPFVVESNGMSVTAVGTAFNVRAFDGDDTMEVGLVEGKVKIEGIEEENEKQVAFLEPGQYLQYNLARKQIQKGSSDLRHLVSWKNGVLHFERASFEDVIEELERWYGVEFAYEASAKPANWDYSSEFENASLENVLKSISYTKNFDFEIVKNKVTLKF
ncbi:MAG: FecR domain-containing protein [Cyclobacteriaceae bacterium]